MILGISWINIYALNCIYIGPCTKSFSKLFKTYQVLLLSSKFISKTNLMIAVDSGLRSSPPIVSVSIIQNPQGKRVNDRYTISHQYMLLIFWKSLLIFSFMEQEDYQWKDDVKDPAFVICKYFHITLSFSW